MSKEKSQENNNNPQNKNTENPQDKTAPNKNQTVVDDIGNPPPPEPPASPAVLDMRRMVKNSLKDFYERKTSTENEGGEPSEPPPNDKTKENEKNEQQKKEEQDKDNDNFIDEKDFPEEIRNRSEETKLNFRRAVQKTAEKLWKEKIEPEVTQYKKKIEELEKTLEIKEKELQEAKEVLQQQDENLKIFAIKKSRPYLEAESLSQESRKQLIEVAQKLNISPQDAERLLTDDLIELTRAKRDIKKNYSEDGETFIEIASDIVKNYIQAEKTKKDLESSSQEYFQKLIEEKERKEKLEKIRKEKERMEAEKTVSRAISEVVYELNFPSSDAPLTKEELYESVYKTLRSISQNEDGMEQLELLTTEIALAKAYEKRIEQLTKELTKMKQMLKTAGAKYADPEKLSHAENNNNSNEEKSPELKRIPISEINRRILQQYTQYAQYAQDSK